MTASLYPADFYQNRRARTAHAASRVLAALPPALVRRSVADIGCGTGTWLAAALAAGAETAFGIEGDWVAPSMLDDARISLTPHDLDHSFAGPRVDLALSLEVAEHLPPARAEAFIADLVALAPAVLFSAAVPGQGGVGHRNEQWQSWWAGIFAANGYRAHDVIRPAIWIDEAIPAWYRQNTVLYLDATTATSLGMVPAEPGALDRIHPAFWDRANRELAHANARPESELLRRQEAQQSQQ